MNFSAYSIRNPLVAIVLFVLLTVAGFIGFERMKVQQFPDMDFPVVVVTVIMPGAAPEQLEKDVAQPIEDRLSSLEGLKRTLTTVQNGAVTLINEFELDVNIQDAVDDVRSAVGEVQGELPADAQSPIISKIGTSGLPIETYVISSDRMNLSELSWFVDDTLKKRLSAVPGVGVVNRVGGVTREIHVDIDPLALQASGGTVAGVSAVLRQTQQDASAGFVDIGGEKRGVRALGGVSGIEQLGMLNVPVKSGASVRLDSIAHIHDGHSETRMEAFLGKTSVVAIEISRSRGASEVTVAKNIQVALDNLVAQTPGLHIQNVYNLAKPVEEEYHSSLRMLIEGGLLAVVVVLLFLRNIRATFVATVALPLSIIPTFAGMYLLGFSLNIISLLALSLVVGILVDDAIVEIENIIRHLRMGKSPYEAAMEAADEIGLAVIATTFTLIAVFLPTAFMSGVIGKFFKQFGWTAAIAVFFSLLVARLLTPMMAAYLLKPEAPRERKESTLMRIYLRFVSFTIRWRWLTLVVTLALFVGSLSLTKYLPKDFLPKDDFSQTRVEIELPLGSSLDDTRKVADMAQNALRDMPEIKTIFSSIGHIQGGMNSNIGDHGTPRKAALNIVLAPRGERPVKKRVELEIAKRLQNIPGALFKVGLNNGGDGGHKVILTSNNWTLLKKTAHQVIHEIHQIPGVGTVRSNEGLPQEELQIIPDTVAMAQYGITTAALAHTIRVATAGDYPVQISKLTVDGRQIPIMVRVAPEYRNDLQTLENLNVMGNNGPVRVASVAKLQFGVSPSALNRYKRERQIMITVDSNTLELGALVKAVNSTPTLSHLPEGVHHADIGLADSMRQLFHGFAIAMLIGVLCILGVLVLLFHKILQPLTILMALPLSVGGAFVALMVTGSSLSMPSLIGLVMLMGIATKNSILLVDYAIIAERQGKKRLEALIDACRKRARPIIMTTVAMGAGMLPLIFGWGGADNSFRGPMAVSVFGGLVTSTLLSLIIIPTFYTFMDDIPKLFRKIMPFCRKEI